MFQIAQSAMDELGGAGRRPRGEVLHFGEKYRITSTHGIACYAAAVDAAARYEDVVNHA